MRFRILRPHAKGGLGAVLLARDEELNRDVAVKEIQPRYADNLSSRSRFIFEAEVTGRLEHPGVVPVYALGRYADGRPYYAMRFITGASMLDAIQHLHQSAKTSDSFDRGLRDLLVRFVSVCRTMHYAHSRGVLHRDLKPANIMLGEYGETLVVDWGLAKRLGDSRSPGDDAFDPSDDKPQSADSTLQGGSAPTREGSILGTLQYMPPEQAAGEISQMGPASDIYSLGATLFHLITGKAPFSEHQSLSSVDQLREKVLYGVFLKPKQLRPQVARELESICLHAMHKDPQRRYQSAVDLADDIESHLADDCVSVVPESLPRKWGRFFRKHRRLALGLGAGLLAIAVIASVAAFRISQQLELARLQQKFDTSLRAQEVRLLDETSPRQIPLDASAVAELVTTINAIERRSAADPYRRARLLDVWNESLRKLAEQPMTDETAAQLQAEIQRLQTAYPWSRGERDDAVQRLQTLAAQRIAAWFAAPTPPFDSQRFVVSEAGYERKTAPQEQWLALLGDSPLGNTKLSVKFSGPWDETTLLGVAINQQQDAGYWFLLADEAYSPLHDDPSLGLVELPTLAESRQQGKLCMFIVRGEQVLRKQPIDIVGDLNIVASREGVLRLSMSVSGREMRVLDPFPLPPSDPGRYGVMCPPGVMIAAATLERQRPQPNQQRSPAIERGDRAYADGRLAEARLAYEQLADRPQEIEARYKLALTYESDDLKQYLRRLQSILENEIPEGGDAETRRWYLFAGVRLLRHHLETPEFQLNVALTLDRLLNNFTLEQVAELVPETEKEAFINQLLKPGQRYRIAYDNEGDVEDLRNSIRSVKLFGGTPLWSRIARWRLSDALRCSPRLTPEQGRAEAIPLLQGLLKEVAQEAAPDEVERVTLIGDLLWMLLLDKKFDEAQQLLQPFLGADSSDLRTQWLPLLVQRARLRHAQGDLAGAVADLESFVNQVNPKAPPPGVNYSPYSEASAMLGMFYFDQGDQAKAKQVWLDGRRRNWIDGFPDPKSLGNARGVAMVLESHVAEPMLSAWTKPLGAGGGYQDNEWRNVIESLFAGSGLDDLAVRKLVFNSERVRDSWKQLVAETTFAGARGEAIGRRTLLRQLPMRDSVHQGTLLVLYQAVLRVTFDGDATLQKHPAADEVLYTQCRAIIDAYQTGRLTQKDMGFILAAWTGGWNEDTFVGLRDRLKDEVLSAGLALVLGRMLVKYGNDLARKTGESVLQQHVLGVTAPIPQVYRDLAQEVLTP